MTIDGGATIGWAYGDPLGNRAPPTSGTFELPKALTSHKMVAYERFLIDLIRENKITDLIIEQNFADAKRSSFQAVTALTGYVIVAGMASVKCGVRCSTVELSSWRSKLGLPTRAPKNVLSYPGYEGFRGKKTGEAQARRRFVKDRAIEFARKQGCDPKDDNEADAVCIFLWKRLDLEGKVESGNRRDLFDDLEI